MYQVKPQYKQNVCGTCIWLLRIFFNGMHCKCVSLASCKKTTQSFRARIIRVSSTFYNNSVNTYMYLWERSLTTSFHCGIWTARSARVRHNCWVVRNKEKAEYLFNLMWHDSLVLLYRNKGKEVLCLYLRDNCMRNTMKSEEMIQKRIFKWLQE